MTMHGRRVLDAIDDASILKTRNPVLFARLANAGASCRDLQEAYGSWEYGLRLPAWAWAYVEAPATRRRANANRAKRKRLRRQRRKAAA